ncbi:MULTISPECIES: 2Fe-2S iron-sulfur cluster-binding protein [Bradyrhizobium]|uniref:2Fe-2S iron-sulfur cluster-binding protein n=1 Tax=Bradyrhizobium TaxID=374 RepID=UPI001CD229DD|nr:MULTISPECIES: 2Fe-2S iron-sulfur cluster-binding protein [unclassified Bradyrhizobium]MCA1427822.1 2Fe-2S iron-sulfur cluster binding domain-containing protein [Bradyrhizobium sp. NBAIM16]MCA1506617.1 2Fe-2S iron-sulfur cluster binding domain-containing protein [Bradyrhizobium sp. NBAIM02]MCA1533519.1 2Fe-2S iron-sulfur cluster binding domain-containing protein [Bradyrhizobium sp. NBAIM03]UWU84223.1 2Fe-2S iron-sulfur cluster-binding protein [Bradyrhizobium sp. CB1024]
MPAITFIHPDGKSYRVETAGGESAMQAATRHGLDGILAECGGNAMCATCHVYVDESWLARLPAMADDEDALLDGTAAERRRTSRLSCQITITPDLDGLVLKLPERQV